MRRGTSGRGGLLGPLGRRQPLHFFLRFRVHDGSAVGRALHRVGPAGHSELGRGGAPDMARRGLGLRVERPSPAARPRDQPVEQRAPAEDERDVELPRGRQRPPERGVERPLGDQEVARARIERRKREAAAGSDTVCASTSTRSKPGRSTATRAAPTATPSCASCRRPLQPRAAGPARTSSTPASGRGGGARLARAGPAGAFARRHAGDDEPRDDPQSREDERQPSSTGSGRARAASSPARRPAGTRARRVRTAGAAGASLAAGIANVTTTRDSPPTQRRGADDGLADAGLDRSRRRPAAARASRTAGSRRRAGRRRPPASPPAACRRTHPAPTRSTRVRRSTCIVCVLDPASALPAKDTRSSPFPGGPSCAGSTREARAPRRVRHRRAEERPRLVRERQGKAHRRGRDAVVLGRCHDLEDVVRSCAVVVEREHRTLGIEAQRHRLEGQVDREIESARRRRARSRATRGARRSGRPAARGERRSGPRRLSG